MRVGIIIPVFNKIEIISECLKLNITHAGEKCFWLIIDNNSDSETKAGLLELKAFAERHLHVLQIESESQNTGVAKAWNKGLSLANTEYICVLNNDCIMMPNWDLELIKVIETEQKDLISPFVVEQMLLPFYSITDFMNGKNNWQQILHKNRNSFRTGVFGGVVFFGKKNIFNTIGKFDEQFWLSCEDIDYCVRALNLNYKIGVTGRVSAFHLTSSTRGKMKVDYAINQNKFQQKWGWRFEDVETNFINKLIKKWHKILLERFYKMSEIHLRLPV